MSESKYREWILDTIDSLRSRKARPDLERICRMVRRRHGSEPDRTCAELEKLIQEQTVLKVNYKGSISYRNAAKVQRRSRKKEDVVAAALTAAAAAARRSAAVEEASHSDLSNGGDSALGAAEQDDDDLEADTSMAMDTDSNADEESRDGQDGPSPSKYAYEAPAAAAARCATTAHRAASAPSSPSGTRPGGLGSARFGPGSGPDGAGPFKKAGERPSSLPPSSPRTLTHNDWAYDASACPVEQIQNTGTLREATATTVKAATLPVTSSPCSLKNNAKKEDGGAKTEESSRLSDQCVPDYAARLEENRNVSDPRPLTLSTLSTPSDNGTAKKKLDMSPFKMADDALLNGAKDDEVSVKKEKMSQNLLQWTVADVASYFSAAGFPEQAAAFRTQEIDGKSLLLMQRSDVLTGLSIRLGPALKIYERHVKVLQRTHFLEYEDL